MNECKTSLQKMRKHLEEKKQNERKSKQFKMWKKECYQIYRKLDSGVFELYQRTKDSNGYIVNHGIISINDLGEHDYYEQAGFLTLEAMKECLKEDFEITLASIAFTNACLNKDYEPLGEYAISNSYSKEDAEKLIRYISGYIAYDERELFRSREYQTER